MNASEKERLVEDTLVQNYEKYYRIVYSHIFREEDACDIVQEGAYRAILRSRTLQKPEYADTWICRIMLNETYRHMKKDSGRPVDIEKLPERGEDDAGIQRAEESWGLKEALEALGEPDRTIVVLRYYEEEKLEDIGRILDMGVSTVKSRLYRAMGKLKKIMEQGGAGDGTLETGI